MSAKLTLFTELRDRIIAQVADVKTVKRWNNQISPENEDREEAFAYPVVFIQMAEITWTPYQQNIQKGDLILTIRSVFEDYETEGTDFYTFTDAVHLAIQGWAGSISSPMIRIAEREDNDHDNCIVWEADYTTLLTDCSTDRRNDLVSHTIGNLELETELDIDNENIRTGDGNF